MGAAPSTYRECTHLVLHAVCVSVCTTIKPEECMLVNTGLPDPLSTSTVTTDQVNNNHLFLFPTLDGLGVANPESRPFVRDLNHIWPLEVLLQPCLIPQIDPLTINPKDQRGVIGVLEKVRMITMATTNSVERTHPDSKQVHPITELLLSNGQQLELCLLWSQPRAAFVHLNEVQLKVDRLQGVGYSTQWVPQATQALHTDITLVTTH